MARAPSLRLDASRRERVFQKTQLSPNGLAIALLETRMTGPEDDSAHGDTTRPTSSDEPVEGGEDEQTVEPRSDDDDWEDWLFL